MNPHVRLQVGRLREGLATLFAHEGSLSCVDPPVEAETRELSKGLPTCLANIWFLHRMDPEVLGEI